MAPATPAADYSRVMKPKVARAALLALLVCVTANAQDSLQWGGFALIRPQTPSSLLFDDDSVSAQLQLGLDWQPRPDFRAHVHALARNDGDEARRGNVGLVQAFLEKHFIFSRDRFRITAGAFFLPTSHENIDHLWETPYTITSSALNTWMGEEFRPVGVDASWSRRTARAGAFTAGATLFSGNDTFGALPIDRGWAIHDRWTLLGEHFPSRTNIYTSVSAETDNRLGWSARGKWNNDNGSFQITRIDNRSDALLYGELYNWATRFNIAGADYTWRQWTVVAEKGWGSTAIVRRNGTRRSYPINAGYLLLSRSLADFRVSVRADEFEARSDRTYAYTGSVLWDVHPRLRAGVEAITTQGEERYSLEFRYRF
jgi:hypothetical protein